MSKVQRQQAIVRLLEAGGVTNQPQLIDALSEQGIKATQATVSRDLDELGAVRVRSADGGVVYALPELAAERLAPVDQLRRVMGEWVASVARSGDMVVLRTPPGCAHVVASALDRSGLGGLLGTVAGDDTIFCIASDKVGGRKLVATIRHLAGLDPNT